MYQRTFATLREKYPDQQALLTALERQLTKTLSLDRDAVIDDRILGQQLHATEDIIRDLLVELVGLHRLRTRKLWTCPNGGGGLWEGSDLAESPDSVECNYCGQAHDFSAADVEVIFVSTDQLLRELLPHGVPTVSMK